MVKIKGGFYLKARCIQNSDIAHAAPYVREIWDWILKEANHKDIDNFKRGTCLRTYKDIQEGLHWFIGWRKMAYSKDDCENAMKWLKKHSMLTTTKTTRGMIINVLNYDKYQTVENYENHKDDHTRTTHEPQTSHTINKNDKNDKNEINNNNAVGFDRFWLAYPKRVGRKTAERAWLKLKATEELTETIIKAVARFKVSPNWLKDNGQFIPNPSTFLNQERWNDELKTDSQNKTTVPESRVFTIEDYERQEKERERLLNRMSF